MGGNLREGWCKHSADPKSCIVCQETEPLKKRIEKLEKQLDKAARRSQFWKDNHAAAEAQLENVRPYLKHNEPCEYGTWVGKDLPLYGRCTCGLQAILENDDDRA